jgi:UDP-N-acetyl-D-mannosaminuronate dehydrogenase
MDDVKDMDAIILAVAHNEFLSLTEAGIHKLF